MVAARKERVDVRDGPRRECPPRRTGATSAAAAATILVPGLPLGLPSFYSDLFAPFAKELISDAALLGNSNLAVFSSASVCCVNSLDRINRTAARELVHAIRRHHLQPAGSADHA